MPVEELSNTSDRLLALQILQLAQLNLLSKRKAGSFPTVCPSREHCGPHGSTETLVQHIPLSGPGGTAAAHILNSATAHICTEGKSQ